MTRDTSSHSLLAALPGLGSLVLIGVVLFAWFQTRSSAELLLRGEANQLLERVHDKVRAQGGPPSDATLRAIVDGDTASDFVFIALVDDEGDVFASSGPEPSDRVQGDLLRGFEPVRAGARGWVLSRPLPGPPPGPEGPREGGPPPRRGRLSILLCFEPKIAARVDRAANTLLLAGILGGLGLAGLSFAALRFVRAREELLARLEGQRRLASLGTMSAVVAHELRNPLAALKGHAQLLVEDLADAPKLRGRAERVVEGALRIERLSSRLLELTRVDARLEPEDVQPAGVVRSALASLDSTRVTLDERRAPELWRLDPLRFQQVVTNLVDNALQAALELPVQVTLTVEDDALVLEVIDHGPGVPVEDRARILEPFVTTRARGVGLGLAITQEIVALHGGTLQILDAEGGGARFRVELPRTPNEEA